MVFDQSAFVKEAIRTLLHEGLIGLALTSLMILIFLASLRATLAVFLSIPLSALTTFVVLYLLGSTVNTMILGGLALAFSRIIDNSVISLENIYRHLEEGESPERAAEEGGAEVSLAVLAATLTTVVVFFPGHVLIRRQQISFHGSGVIRGYFFIRLLFRGDDRDPTVLRPVSQRLSSPDAWWPRRTRRGPRRPLWERGSMPPSTGLSQACWISMSGGASRGEAAVLYRSGSATWHFSPALLSILLFGVAFFPRTDAGQFTINVKVPTGTPD